MEIALVIYGVSWIILLLGFLYAKFKSDNTKENEAWHRYALIIALAPFVAFMLIPYLIVDEWLKDRKQGKLKKEREAKEKLEEEIKKQALSNYEVARQNNSSALTKDFVEVASKLINVALQQKYSSIISCIDKISVPSNFKLDVEECKNIGMGDNSNVVIRHEGGIDGNIWPYLSVQQNNMGAWQAYLLHSLWHVLPLFWHGGYDRRHYIFSSEDLYKIQFEQEVHSRELKAIFAIENFDVVPNIAVNENKFYVSCCFWSDWGGLIRETIEITFENNRVTNILHLKYDTIFGYECGIMY